MWLTTAASRDNKYLEDECEIIVVRGGKSRRRKLERMYGWMDG